MAKPFPWSWSLPAAVVTAATAGLGALRYPSLPDRIPVHFAHGVADRTVASTLVNAFLPVIAQVLVTGILGACAALTLIASRSSPPRSSGPVQPSSAGSPSPSSAGSSSPDQRSSAGSPSPGQRSQDGSSSPDQPPLDGSARPGQPPSAGLNPPDQPSPAGPPSPASRPSSAALWSLAVPSSLATQSPAAGRSSPGAGVLARALLFLAACLDLALFFVAAPIWRGDSSLGRGPTTEILATILVGLVGLLGGIVYATVQARMGAAEASGDDSHWVGFIYANREDRSLLVPKRYGIGLTLNFGRPVSWVILGLLLAIPIIGTLLAAASA
jgi:hypothetical protein